MPDCWNVTHNFRKFKRLLANQESRSPPLGACSPPLSVCSPPFKLSVISSECGSFVSRWQLRHCLLCVVRGNGGEAATLKKPRSRLRHRNSVASSSTEYKSFRFTIRNLLLSNFFQIFNQIQNILWIRLAVSGN
jgi:hypothetical protein